MNGFFYIRQGIDDQINDFCLSKYNSFYISRTYIYSHYKIESIYTVLLNISGAIEDVFFIFIDKKNATVLNKLIEIKDDIAQSLSKFILDEFNEVDCIIFDMLTNKLNLNNCFSYYNNSDICVDLPTDIDSYNKQLGTKSRQHYKYYRKKISKDFNSTLFVVNKRYSPEDSYLIDKLIELKDERCKKMNEINLAKSNIESMKQLANDFGLISFISIDDMPICVLLFYLTGKQIYFEQTAFDENYYKYSVGRTLLYWSIIDSIENEINKFHFLWKGADYKNHYSATEYKLYNSCVFRKKCLKYYAIKIKVNTRLTLRSLKRSKAGEKIYPIIKNIVYSLKKRQ
jgi:hypothetical protein